MNTYNINDNEFKNSEIYKNFMNENNSRGGLKIRAYSASGAVPIVGMKVIVSTIYDNNIIIFFEGETDSSGVIERISLPTPSLNMDNLDTPNKRTYQIKSSYDKNSFDRTFNIDMYEGVSVIQNINVVPDLMVGGFFGS